MNSVERWSMMEIAFEGKSDGNPFLDYSAKGIFRSEHETVRADGFYDGNNVWRVRFMPSYEGSYSYTISGTALDTPLQGAFEVIAPSGDNHGPVRVADQIALAYEDGTPYYSIGTTCYAWVHQPIALQEQTLSTLEKSPFNKIRFCIFPKFYEYNRKEPLTYPFARGNGEGIDPALVKKEIETRVNYPGALYPEIDDQFDYFRPNIVHFQRFDERIAQLQKLGIEADLILMHPYDRWGMNEMSREACDAYLRYVVARYGAYRNVWWSLSNEYDFIRTKTLEDWERYGQLIQAHDPYGHMCSIHNGTRLFDYSRPWITHQSLQRVDFYRHVEYTDEFLEKYHKPVVWDEICYEGNIGIGWGNISAQELVRRFWEAFLRGGHAGHGETYLDENDILWWSHGGVLKGESAPRLAFLKSIMEQTPGRYMKIGHGMFDEVTGRAEFCEERQNHPFVYDYYIHYLGICQPANRMLFLPEDEDFSIEVIDTWNMTIERKGIFHGTVCIDLPGNQYMAIRVQKV